LWIDYGKAVVDKMTDPQRMANVRRTFCPQRVRIEPPALVKRASDRLAGVRYGVHAL
jgi:hypothetical protein